MNETQKGNIFIIAELIIWSLFPVVSILGFAGVPSMVSLFWVNVFAAIFFFILMIFSGRLAELKNKKAWVYTIGTVILINTIFYGLFFYGLSKTVAANGAIVALFEVVPSYIFFQLIKKEHFSLKHLLGLALAIIGALIVLLPKSGHVNVGDFIILVAVFFPPFGNWCQQQTRKLISTESALFLRHILAVPFLYLLAQLLHTDPFRYDLQGVIGWLLLNGILIFGISKIFWIEAIHRMSVTRALSIASLSPIFTVIFAWILLAQVPTLVQLLSLPFLIVAVLLLTDFTFKKPPIMV